MNKLFLSIIAAVMVIVAIALIWAGWEMHATATVRFFPYMLALMGLVAMPLALDEHLINIFDEELRETKSKVEILAAVLYVVIVFTAIGFVTRDILTFIIMLIEV